VATVLTILLRINRPNFRVV